MLKVRTLQCGLLGRIEFTVLTQLILTVFNLGIFSIFLQARTIVTVLHFSTDSHNVGFTGRVRIHGMVLFDEVLKQIDTGIKVTTELCIRHDLGLDGIQLFCLDAFEEMANL